MTESGRLLTLDGLRGVAAIMVMIGHRYPSDATHTYLAVDLFFGLSGFVLALAYENRLRQGLTIGQFALLRLARVYPMYLVGMLCGLAIIGGSPLSLLMIPDFADAEIYRSNVPMWSLLFELIVNVGYAVCSPRLGRHGLMAILIVSGLFSLTGIVAHGDANVGSSWATAGLGLSRTTFSFALGVAMFRLRRHLGIGSRQTRLAWLLLPVLVMLTAIPGATPYYDLTCVFIGFPVILWLGSIWEAPKSLLLAMLGDLSFPLYCIHNPFVTRFNGSSQAMMVVFVILIFVAWWSSRVLDKPLRKMILGVIRRSARRATMA